MLSWTWCFRTQNAACPWWMYRGSRKDGMGKQACTCMPSIFFLINSVENEKAALRHLYTILLHPLTVQSQGLLFPLLNLPNLSKSNLIPIESFCQKFATRRWHMEQKTFIFLWFLHFSTFLFIPFCCSSFHFSLHSSSFRFIPISCSSFLFIPLGVSSGIQKLATMNTFKCFFCTKNLPLQIPNLGFLAQFPNIFIKIFVCV